jgi:hypothetical protein
VLNDDDDELALATLEEGRPAEVSGDQLTLFLKTLAMTGSTRKAAETARPDLSAKKAMTYFRNLELRDGDFAELKRKALVASQARLEEVLYDHAVNGVEEPVFFNGEVVGTITKFDHKLAVTLAKRNARILGDDSWEEKKTVVHEGEQKVVHQISLRDLPPEERRRVLAERQKIKDTIEAQATERKTP